MHINTVPMEARDGVRSRTTEVISGCELTGSRVGNGTQILCKSTACFLLR